MPAAHAVSFCSSVSVFFLRLISSEFLGRRSFTRRFTLTIVAITPRQVSQNQTSIEARNRLAQSLSGFC
ncbi:hypothetical protein TYRP_010331 [Tyrophagus putrescentiae]|nr:hypothetical protein TYRP_010331 [Tyrophagus putrescentiae]